MVSSEYLQDEVEGPFSRLEDGLMGQGDVRDTWGAPQARHAGAESSLDLKEEHLTDSHRFRPVSRGFPGEFMRGWYCPEGWTGPAERNYVAKVQSFAAGGYELTVKSLDLAALARMSDAPRKRGKRDRPKEVDPGVSLKSAYRAKRTLRHQVKNIGADRLFTVTKRESEGSGFWNESQWAAAWDRFRRMAKKAGIDLLYVAVLERHAKGNFHMHVAITGWINIKLARGIWWAIVGRGQGNVDVNFRRNGTRSRLDRSARIARYISKYISKGFEGDQGERFNKKRYWASRHGMPEARRIILSGLDAGSAFREAMELFGLNPMKCGARDNRNDFFVFADDQGFWLSYTEFISVDPPF